ncbi:MAG TPA: divergent PAP2 family protein [Planctomycetaceae bacterium]|nr:divergent PAP2 family protein [Planctomycetaceae bacterium]
MSISYAIAPLAGWLAAGTLKSVINSIKARELRLDLFGYGGLPSTHTTIVCTTATLIGLLEKPTSPAFAVATTVAVLVMMDAVHLRRWVGQHATALNLLRASEPDFLPFQERVGHRPWEITAGLLLGVACAFLLYWTIA